ncbi:hypothetical protein GWI33_014664 [Rhynchophorus ferrugineus]|uniref:Uncharacterized protein n=1 Tax=Rhynchophorus ferrugineus TaxID=354439 RepID=A0A834I4Q8_RHYFE|nr:hypothetical protein GWI33_014664 [Rhynchophorus ferrugineus]
MFSLTVGSRAGTHPVKKKERSRTRCDISPSTFSRRMCGEIAMPGRSKPEQKEQQNENDPLVSGGSDGSSGVSCIGPPANISFSCEFSRARIGARSMAGATVNVENDVFIRLFTFAFHILYL